MVVVNDTGEVKIVWATIDLESKRFRCGYCNQSISSERGFRAETYVNNKNIAKPALIYICHSCSQPNYFDPIKTQHPTPVYGNNVSGVEESVYALYIEARKCMSVASYTAAVMSCRKLLMNISVSKGAKEGEEFASYVSYLVTNNYVPPRTEAIVQHIKNLGNESNHQIVARSREEAEGIIDFSEIILRFVFEVHDTLAKNIKTEE